jgi:SEL1 protein
VNTHQGTLAFDEAISHLHTIKPATAPWWNFDKKSGILGTSAYYAKEVFFLLFMNGPPQQELLTTNPQPRKLGQSLSQAVELLEEAATHRTPTPCSLSPR